MRKYIITTFVFIILILPTNSVYALPDYELTTSDGKKTSLADYQGEPLLFLAMTTSCSSCKLQNTYIKEVNSATTNFTILSIAMDPKLDDVNSINHYKVNQNIPWIITIDTSGELMILYQIESYPQLFFVDEAGEIIKRWKYVVETDEILDTIDDFVEVGEVTTEKNPLIEMLFNNWFFKLSIISIVLLLPGKKIWETFRSN